MRKLILLVLFLPLIVFAGQLSSYGPTSGSDQLWQIAILARPTAKVSIQQAMVAIFRANPKAFVAGNMNRLKPNVTLQIPNQGAMQQVDADQAINIVEQQEHIWHKKQTKELNGIVEINKQYSNVGKVLISFDQQYQVRLADLEQHNLAMQNQIDQLQQQIASLQERFVGIQTKQEKQGRSFFASYVGIVSKTFGTIGSKVLVIFIAVFLLILLWRIRSCRSHKYSGDKKEVNIEKQERNDDEDTKSEYDFLGSKEGIPAKLDLARAYIDMDDVKSAKDILQEITGHGDPEQKEEAKKLLKSL